MVWLLVLELIYRNRLYALAKWITLRSLSNIYSPLVRGLSHSPGLESLCYSCTFPVPRVISRGYSYTQSLITLLVTSAQVPSCCHGYYCNSSIVSSQQLFSICFIRCEDHYQQHCQYSTRSEHCQPKEQTGIHAFTTSA